MTAGEGRVGGEAGGRLGGRRVLVVEDEMIVAMMIEDILSDHGAVVMGPAARVAPALALAAEGPDVALLDMNLGGDSTAPVAALLAGAGVPFAFATGYGAAGVPAEFRGRPVLQKPFREEELVRVLEEALGAPA